MKRPILPIVIKAIVGVAPRALEITFDWCLRSRIGRYGCADILDRSFDGGQSLPNQIKIAFFGVPLELVDLGSQSFHAITHNRLPKGVRAILLFCPHTTLVVPGGPVVVHSFIAVTFAHCRRRIRDESCSRSWSPSGW